MRKQGSQAAAAPPLPTPKIIEVDLLRRARATQWDATFEKKRHLRTANANGDNIDMYRHPLKYLTTDQIKNLAGAVRMDFTSAVKALEKPAFAPNGTPARQTGCSHVDLKIDGVPKFLVSSGPMDSLDKYVKFLWDENAGMAICLMEECQWWPTQAGTSVRFGTITVKLHSVYYSPQDADVRFARYTLTPQKPIGWHTLTPQKSPEHHEEKTIILIHKRWAEGETLNPQKLTFLTDTIARHLSDRPASIYFNGVSLERSGTLLLALKLHLDGFKNRPIEHAYRAFSLLRRQLPAAFESCEHLFSALFAQYAYGREPKTTVSQRVQSEDHLPRRSEWWPFGAVSMRN